ncbi:IQ domain-containing protein C [Mastacembelus armatus]|uniref:IQ domain-containing protein C n=1 Tax=Mastacembelus armatus TaxID=205130 RepID=UPI000E461B18|nr:IQ domain-containing protein C [Mastacembelus armatus]
MDRSKWEKILSCFQAFARGYLVRNEVCRARRDFEDIVKEIDGSLSHVEWKDTVIPMPHFADTHGPFLRPSSFSSKPSDPGLKVSASPHSPVTVRALPQERGRDQHVLEKTEAERDDSQSKGQASPSRDCFLSSHVGRDEEGQKQMEVRNQDEDKDRGMMDSTEDSTSIWSSLDQEMNYSHSHKGSQQYCLAQEVPCTPDDLRLHRNTLTMELVWLQQAIDSRKKYLSLKDSLSVS